MSLQFSGLDFLNNVIYLGFTEHRKETQVHIGNEIVPSKIGISGIGSDVGVSRFPGIIGRAVEPGDRLAAIRSPVEGEQKIFRTGVSLVVLLLDVVFDRRG